MANGQTTPEERNSLFERLGLVLAGLFFVVSAVVVHLRGGADSLGIASDVKTISVAHWQLESGFREGMDKAIKEFEAKKAAEGQKVKVVQIAIPFRGYSQWFMTQIIGGKPADVIEHGATSHILNQYFIPLTPYIGKPNPSNAGTPLEGMPWKDTFVDGMESAIDATYGECFSAGLSYGVNRLFVNMDLLAKATGSRRLPETVQEWVAICEQLRAYGVRQGKTVIPIGVNGMSRSFFSSWLSEYFAQTNGYLNGVENRYCGPAASPADMLEGLRAGRVDRRRLLAAADIVRQLGQCFGEGFSSVGAEQVKFLYYSGQVGFMWEGSWDARALTLNAPFEVKIMARPPLGRDHKYSGYYVGRSSEQGAKVGIRFAIPKATHNFDLALEFVQWISSWRINQMIMAEAEWAPAVRQAKLEGVLNGLAPIPDGEYPEMQVPFYSSWGSRTSYRIWDSLQTIVITNPADPGEYLWKQFRSLRSEMVDELNETVVDILRSDVDREMNRSQIGVGSLRKDLTDMERARLKLRRRITDEVYVLQLRVRCETLRTMAAVESLGEVQAWH